MVFTMASDRCGKMLKKQREVMVHFMVGHRNVALGKFEGAQGKVRMENSWRELRDLLRLHGPDKTMEQWKRAWKDLRMKARSKNARLISERTATGNTRGNTPPLNEMEKLILTIIGVETSTPAVELEFPQPEYEVKMEGDLPLQTEVVVGLPLVVETEDNLPLEPPAPTRGQASGRVQRTPPSSSRQRLEDTYHLLTEAKAWQRKSTESIAQNVQFLRERQEVSEATSLQRLQLESQRLEVEKERLVLERERLALERENQGVLHDILRVVSRAVDPDNVIVYPCEEVGGSPPRE